jgi:hypothetical protein
MTRGFRNHKWYKLLDEEGVPIPSASVWIYDYKRPTIELTLFDADDNLLTQPIYTTSEGVLEFYVKDHIRSSTNGYTWDTQFVISWSKDDKSGIIRGDHLFGEFESVTLSGNVGRLNKAISNFIGWNINAHVDFDFGSTNRCGSSSSSSSSTSSSSSSSSSLSSSSSSSSRSSSSTSSSSTNCYFLDDDCSGTFSTNWINNSNSNPAIYDSGRLRLHSGGSSNQGGNALTQISMPTSGAWDIEFDWYAADSSQWYDDDWSDAECEVGIVHSNPTYYPLASVYNRCERKDGWSPYRKLAFQLMSAISEKVGWYNKYGSSWDYSLTHLSFHHITIRVDWDNYTMAMTDSVEGVLFDVSFNSAMLAEFDGSWKVNFHWHSYARNAYQYFDNIKIRLVSDECSSSSSSSSVSNSSSSSSSS